MRLAKIEFNEILDLVELIPIQSGVAEATMYNKENIFCQERSHSGRVRALGKRVREYLRGFESPPLRL